MRVLNMCMDNKSLNIHILLLRISLNESALNKQFYT